jgi:hypothetical protein
MQIKTIQKTIVNKLNEWLVTIEDIKLRDEVKKNILVSGGSITSMLLNEPVNDYDIYINDMSVLVKLSNYYVSGNLEIKVLDGRNLKDYIDKHSSDYRECNIEDIHNSYATSLRTLKENQVKLYFHSSKGGLKVNENKKELNYDVVFFSPNAISLSNDIQIVTRFHGNNEDIHKTFDFIHATNYFTFEKGLVTNKAALESILTKQLKYQGSLYPLTTIIRIKKFLKRGWNINAGEMLKVMFQISELDLKNIDVLEDQLIGVDVAYFGKLIEVLRAVENLETKINSTYLNAIIDKVFNDFDEEI